jgi:hypothetical protein
MNAPQIKVLDARLAEIVKQHCERFEQAVGKPMLPPRSAIIKEIESREFETLGISAIADAFFNRADPWVNISEALETPSMGVYRRACLERAQLIKRFGVFLRTVRTKFRDRILFGNEAADLLLTDFENYDAADAFKKKAGAA